MKILPIVFLLELLMLTAGCVSSRAAGTIPPGGVIGNEYEVLTIPPGHLPPPGQCRIWFPERPPGHQPPPAPCSELELAVPPGAWLIEAPVTPHDSIIVSEFDGEIPSLVISIRYYNPETGRLLEEKQIHRKR